MSLCPYTWVRSFWSSDLAAPPGELAKNLHVRVIRDNQEIVRVALPAQSARWLIELIPEDVVAKIRAERIPLDDILEDLKLQAQLYPRPIFHLQDSSRQVEVWLA